MTNTNETTTTPNYDMIGFGRVMRTRQKGDEYVSISITDPTTKAVTERYAIYNNDTGMIVKTRPGKGSTEKGKLVGTAEEAKDRKGGTYTIVKFNDETKGAMFLFPNRKRAGENPPDFYVTKKKAE